MINIFYVPGMFGSTIEYVLRNFTQEYEPSEGIILNDGSMHSYKKEAHLARIPHIQRFLESNSQNSISTPIYPFEEIHLPEILHELKPIIDKNNVSFLLYADCLEACELTMLFQYYKIAIGLDLKLDIFCYGNENNIKNWNKSYASWRDMQVWELREWLSLFYVEWVREWQESIFQVPDHFIQIKNTDFLYNTAENISKIIAGAQLTPKKSIVEFAEMWQKKQQYVVDEFDLLDQIVNCSIDNQSLSWKKICIISEAIVQQKLRSKGYEIQCDSLNNFPNDAKTLHKLLYKC
jgi:hypothetical protein